MTTVKTGLNNTFTSLPNTFYALGILIVIVHTMNDDIAGRLQTSVCGVTIGLLNYYPKIDMTGSGDNNGFLLILKNCFTRRVTARSRAIFWPGKYRVMIVTM